MDADRWRQIEELYHAALDLPAVERASLLDRADLELRREVESLLEQNGSILDRPAWDGKAGEASATVTMITAGTQLGPYRVERSIGEGGMGQVFRAVDTRLGRAVAIKTSNSRFDARFEREARAIARLNHPNICTLHDVGPNYLVMELVDGETLAARLKKGPLPLEQALKFGAQIADALAASHAKAIVHRDLKPGNVMIAKAGVKVLDFGIAKSSGDTTLTGSHAVIGTPAYMSPEQREGEPCDARTDIFALGLILYEMTFGKRPGQTPELNALPQQFGHVIERCLNPDPERRWQTATDLKEELGWAGDQSSAVRADKPSQPRWVAALAAALLMIVGCYALWLRTRPPEVQQTLRFRIAPPSGAEFFRAPNRGGIALSADGRMLAFTAVRDGQMRIWVQPLDSTAAREIPGTEGAYYPFWSPDGRALAFFAGRSLKRIDIESARLQELCMVERGGAGSWNREGVILFDSIGTVYRIAAGGGKREPVSSPDTSRGETALTGPQFLTDGRRFLYTINSQNPEVSGVYAGSLDDPKVKVRLARTDSWVLPVRAGRQVTDYLLWARGDTIVAQKWNPSALQLIGEPLPLGGPVGLLGGTPALTVSQNGLLVYGPPVELQVAWVDVAGRSVGSIGNTGFVSAPQLSPDGRKFAYIIAPPSPAPLFILDLARNVTSRIPAAAAGLAAWSPDGSLIAFDGLRDGVYNVVYRRADGGGTERVSAPSGRNQHVVGWLGDGKSLVYYESNPERRKRELWVTPLVGGKPVLLRSSSANEPHAQLSTDTKWLAYTSDESGRLEVYAQRFQIDAPESGQRWQISDNGGNFPRWRRDGKELFYLSADGGLMSVSIKVSATALEIGPPRPLFPLPTIYAGTYSYDVAQDGLRFLVAGPSSSRGREPLSVIVNWPAALGN